MQLEKIPSAIATGARASLLIMERLVLLLLICVFLPAVYSQSQPWIGNLSAYELASFRNPVQVIQIVKTQLDHFSIHPDTGDVYIGAVNYIYRLDENLVQVVNVSTATGAGEQYVNYNKILVLQGGRLITCGSERNPAMGIRWCASRNEEDLLDGSTGQSDNEVAAFGNYTTESIVAPGLYNGDSVSRLYVATTYCREGCDGTWSVPPVSRRLLLEGVGFMFALPDDDTVKRSGGSAFAFFPISYVSSFIWKEFTYFVSFRREDAGDARHVSKMSRVCHDSPNLDSYTEILIQCDSQAGNNMYSLVQAAHVGPAGPYLSQLLNVNDEEVLYAVFAKNAANEEVTDVPQPEKGSALCMYKMSDIEAAFGVSVEGCLTKGNDYSVGYLANAPCTGSSTPPIDTDLYCDALSQYKYADGIDPVVSTAVLELPDHLTSSIITSIEVNHTVAFIGTTEAQLLKVHIESGSSARLYEQIPIPFDDNLKGFTANPVKRDMKINDTTGELHLLTEQKFLKMLVENCGQYTTCETCIGTDAGMDGDPYCGWCTLQRQCTRYNECPLPDVSSRWLSYNDPQCIAITDIAPYDSHPITLSEQQITLTVQQLPDLLNSSRYYICNFDDVFSNQANKSGDTLQCTTPPSNLIPEIMMADDHSSMLLSVESTETGVNFVDREFSFYDCSSHTSCVSCVGSRWACDWCVFENRCTHESTSCSEQNEVIVTGRNNKGSSMQGPDSCPQLQIQGNETLVSTGVDRQIIVQTENLPDSAQIKSYQCSLNIEGGKQSAAATRENDVLTCEDNSYTYTADEQELNVDLTVEWTDTNDGVHLLDDRYSFKVRLYKCESLRPDCSRCVSEETTQEELGCVWCDGICAVNDSAVCLMTNSMVTRDNGLNCPDPVIEEILPTSGPIQGNTSLTLSGTDLGRQFDDVQEITVGGQPCDASDFRGEYQTGASVTCRTKAQNGSEPLEPLDLIVIVTGLNGALQTGTRVGIFTYKDPIIREVTPMIGPQSGGTLVTIKGTSLDAGSVIVAHIGDLLCVIERDKVNDNNMTCLTSGALETGEKDFTVLFDGSERNTSMMYKYEIDPTVGKVVPSKSVLAGGRVVKVNGTNLHIIQKPQILITVDEEELRGDCTVMSETSMSCITPAVQLPNSSQTDSPTRRRRAAEDGVNVTTGFIMDGVVGLRNWCSDQTAGCTPMEYVQNPVYYGFDHPSYGYTDGTGIKDGSKLQVRGNGINYAITSEEITVYVGDKQCTRISIGEANLFCDLPEDQPRPSDYSGENAVMNLPIVTVKHGTIDFTIGPFRYSTIPLLIIIISVICAAVILVAVILAAVLARKSAGASKEVYKCLEDIDRVQRELGEDMRRAFAELQTDMTDLTSDLEGLGMPFVGQRDYATNMLFVALETKPMTSDPVNPEEHVERAMKKFSDLLGNKTFLLTIIQVLDAERESKLPVREKAAIASLLTVVMMAENKLGYLTDILFSLMTQMVQDSLDNNRPRTLFRRTESIVEKLLSNWIALCLYDSVKDYTGYPLFLLYRAIKCHCENGPMDVISGQAKFTLSDERLLTEDVEFREMTLTVIVNDADGETKEVKVLDIDSISQVKEKILDAIFRNKPYSTRPSAKEVDLEWRSGKAGHIILQDVDPNSPNLEGWKRVGTLKYFHVPNKSKMALVSAQAMSSQSSNFYSQESAYANVGFTGGRSNRFTVVEADPEDTARLWHLTKVEDSYQDDTSHKTVKQLRRRSMMPSRPKKRFREIFIPRLISTKGTIQQYIDHMFQSILDADHAPRAVKYLFDFFDSQSVRHDIEDSGAVKVWKGNSLPLRFWSGAIRRPDFIFDIRPSRPVEASMEVIAQAFYDAHEANDQKLGKNSDLSKLLFKKDLDDIDRLVQSYYDDIYNMPRVSFEELNKELIATCQNFTGLFSKLSTLLQLWDYIRKFNEKIVDALEEGQDAQVDHLAFKMVEIEQILANEDSSDEHDV
ncbi:plexin-B-like [Asterias rubens]|uniref:plexin-B-like n=1 Tax=Asterias rubens TaxID=7604 RepID=UPI00145584D2|nr:plexin-B-like [Asterias rubens]XP_033645776.1 plexin-B-like [Asterias rubens]